MNKTIYAYAAGVIDADGSITIVKRYPTSTRTDMYHLKIRVGTCDKELPEWFMSNFGGTISFRKRPNPNHRDLYTWIIEYKKSLKVLYAIEPYLIVKKKQAQLAIQFQLIKSNRRGIKKTTDEERKRDEDMYIQMRLLKRGSHKSIITCESFNHR